jgi:hypothetical protein
VAETGSLVCSWLVPFYFESMEFFQILIADMVVNNASGTTKL